MFLRFWGEKVMVLLSKKSVLFIFIVFSVQFLMFSLEKEGYLSNSYYKPLVEKLEEPLLALDNVRKADVFRAANPFPFTPDLFYIEVETSNGHDYILECITVDLTFYKSLTRIRRIDGIEYVTVRKYLWNEFSDRGIVLSKISGIKNIQVRNLKDFLENEEVLYEYFTQPSDDIRHERNTSIIFHKIKKK